MEKIVTSELQDGDIFEFIGGMKWKHNQHHHQSQIPPKITGLGKSNLKKPSIMILNLNELDTAIIYKEFEC